MHLKKLRSNTHINLSKICDKEFKSLPPPTDAHTIETYFRLKLPAILPKIDKVIYLDADTIVVGDIEKLWDEKLGDNILLAVEDPKYIHESRLADLGMKNNSPYFNAGVLLMNLAKMRVPEFERKLNSYVRKKFKVLKFLDQDILNALSEGCWTPLPLAFNSISPVCRKRRKNEFIFYTKDDAKQARQHPFIIHFTVTPKPWNPGCIDPRRGRYWEYTKKTNFSVPKPNLLISMRKFLTLKTFYFIKDYFPGCAKIFSGFLAMLRSQSKN